MRSEENALEPRATPFVADLLDFVAAIHPLALKLAFVIVLGGLLAVAPTITRWLIVVLVMLIVPAALDLRGRLATAQRQLRKAAKIEAGACAALRIAIARVDELEGELDEIRRRPTGSTNDPIYRRVGLDADAPDYVVQAARRAHRLALHPDKHPPEQRQAAHERYVAAEAAFDGIARRRNP